MNKKKSHLLEQLKGLKDRTLSFKNQYDIESENPDIDFLNIEIDRVKEVILAHTEMKSLLRKKEDTVSMLFSYLNDEKFSSDQEGLMSLLNVAK